MQALRALYDPVFGLTMPERRLRSMILEQAGIEAGHRVLDVGCGTGSQLMLLSGRNRHTALVGVEPDAGMLDIAAKKGREAHREIRWTSGSALFLPFQSQAFDRVLTTFVLHHLDTTNKGDALAEIFRVLRPGGQLHIADWGKPHTILMRIASISLKVFEPSDGVEANLLGQLPELCAHAGFWGVRQTLNMSTTFGTVTMFSAVRPAESARAM